MSKRRTIKRLTYKLINTPFFPLLFISEATKIAVLQGLGQDLYIMVLLSVISTVLWVVSDAIDIDVDTEDIVG
jgi:hypothetical protein